MINLNIFLKAKHWQIFLWQFAIPFVLYIFFIIYVIFRAITENNPNVIFEMIPYINFITILTLITYYGWIWAIGSKLISKAPSDLKLNLNFLKIGILLVSIFTILYMFFTNSLLLGGSNNILFNNPLWFLLLIPLYLLMLFCAFYIVYFTSRLIKSIEMGKSAELGDYIVDFILIMFVVVGIWFIQPRINKIIENRNQEF